MNKKRNFIKCLLTIPLFVFLLSGSAFAQTASLDISKGITVKQMNNALSSKIDLSQRGQPLGVATTDKNNMMNMPVSGDISPSNIQSSVVLYKTTGITVCPASPWVGGNRFGEGYSVGDRIRTQDGSIITVTGVKSYTLNGNTLNGGIDTFDITYAATNTTDMTTNASWSNWSMMIDKPWMNGYFQPVKNSACFYIASTDKEQSLLSSNVKNINNLSNFMFDPKMFGVKFDGSDTDKTNIQNYVDNVKPSTFKVNGNWPTDFVLSKTNNSNGMLIDATSVPGTTMYGSGKSDGDTYIDYYNGVLDIQKTDNTSGISTYGVVQIKRTLNTPNQTAYYQSGEYSDTPILELIGNDTGTTGQLKGMNVTINSTQSKGFVSQEQLYAGGGDFTGKSGHWIYNGGFTDKTHEPSSESSWENTGIEFNMGASGVDCTRCLYDPVDHAGRQIFVAEIGNFSTDSWAASKSYTAKYDYYGSFCQMPGLESSCMMYNPDHSDHVSGVVTTTDTYNLSGENVVYNTNTQTIKSSLKLNKDYDTIQISGDWIPEQTVTGWTYTGTGIVFKLASNTTGNNSNANIKITVTHKIPYIFRAVAPNGDNLKTSKADYVATSTTTEPDWSKHLDGKVFAEQVDSSGKPVTGSVWWQMASEDTFGVGSAFSLTGHSRQYYDVGFGSNATYDDAAIDLSGSNYRNSDGKSAQIRLNDRVPAIDFTAAMDSDETITGSGISGLGPEQYKNNHTLGYDPNISALSYKVNGVETFHIKDDGSFYIKGQTKANILSITNPEEGQLAYDTDDHTQVTYRCPTSTTCAWYPVQYGKALSN